MFSRIVILKYIYRVSKKTTFGTTISGTKGCFFQDALYIIYIWDKHTNKPAVQAAGADSPPLKLHQEAKSTPLVKWP